MAGVIVCGPPRGVVRRIYMNCPTCERRTGFTDRFMGAYYGDLTTCVSCGDSWSEGERMERPFRRGWRAESIATAKKEWAAAMPAAEWWQRVRESVEAGL